METSSAVGRLRALTGGPLRPGGLELTRRALEALRLAAGARVLDLGCGCGDTLVLLREQAGLRAMGLDIRPDRLAQARKRCTNGLVLADAGRLPLADERFDAVFCECALSLCADKARVLAEMGRILNKGGGLALADVYLRTSPSGKGNSILDSDDGTTPRTCLEGARPLRELRRLVESAGFVVELEEDHTPSLTRLAGELIFAYGSLSAFWAEMAGAGSLACADVDRARKLGYCLLVARKGRNAA